MLVHHGNIEIDNNDSLFFLQKTHESKNDLYHETGEVIYYVTTLAFSQHYNIRLASKLLHQSNDIKLQMTHLKKWPVSRDGCNWCPYDVKYNLMTSDLGSPSQKDAPYQEMGRPSKNDVKLQMTHLKYVTCITRWVTYIFTF